MIVDVHTHIWDSPQQLGPDATERIRRSRGQPWERPDASVKSHEEAMKPVQVAIVLGFVSQRLGANVGADQVAACVARGPDKLFGFAGIDPMANDYLEQYDRALELGLSGVTISPAGQDFHPCHTHAQALYERCESKGLPVMVHPGAQFSSASVMEFAQPHLFDDVARDFPKLRIVLAQVGHPWIDPALALVGKHPHVWADLSDLVLRPWQLYTTLLAAHQQGVMDHLLLGSDFPFCTPQQAITTIYSINTYTQGTNLPSVPREQLRGIVERDALACLGLRGMAPSGAEDAEQHTDEKVPEEAKAMAPSADASATGD